MDIVNETESRYLEIVSTGRKVLKKALHKYGEDVRHLTGGQFSVLITHHHAHFNGCLADNLGQLVAH